MDDTKDVQRLTLRINLISPPSLNTLSSRSSRSPRETRYTKHNTNPQTHLILMQPLNLHIKHRARIDLKAQRRLHIMRQALLVALLHRGPLLLERRVVDELEQVRELRELFQERRLRHAQSLADQAAQPRVALVQPAPRRDCVRGSVIVLDFSLFRCVVYGEGRRDEDVLPFVTFENLAKKKEKHARSGQTPETHSPAGEALTCSPQRSRQSPS